MLRVSVNIRVQFMIRNISTCLGFVVWLELVFFWGVIEIIGISVSVYCSVGLIFNISIRFGL